MASPVPDQSELVCLQSEKDINVSLCGGCTSHSVYPAAWVYEHVARRYHHWYRYLSPPGVERKHFHYRFRHVSQKGGCICYRNRGNVRRAWRYFSDSTRAEEYVCLLS